MKSAKIALLAALGLFLPLVFVSAASGQARHTVVAGDTLSYLAQVYVVTIDEIASLNNIADPNLIVVGQELLIPGGSAGGESAGEAPGGSYVVAAGDTLSGIASQFGVSVDDIAAANVIGDKNLIVVGETLTIPGSMTAPLAPDPAPAPASPPPLMFPGRPNDPEMEALMDDLAAQNGVSAGLVKAVATVESGWNQYVESYAGAVGVMQIMPGTAEWLETHVIGQQLNEVTSAYDNVKMGVALLAILLGETGGDERAAVAAYYQGLAPTQAGVYYPDTTDYADMVLRVRSSYWP